MSYDFRPREQPLPCMYCAGGFDRMAEVWLARMPPTWSAFPCSEAYAGHIGPIELLLPRLPAPRHTPGRCGMNDHTRGPWCVGPDTPNGLQIDCDGGTVAEGVCWRPDAHLIAAAPDLLAFVQRVAKYWMVSCPTLALEAERLVEQAEGKAGSA